LPERPYPDVTPERSLFFLCPERVLTIDEATSQREELMSVTP
jgi:hypothetical protein